MPQEAGEPGLTDYEYAFYMAVAENDSARELMGKDKLRELAVVLTEKVRANASIDWNIKEDVQAQLRVIIRRALRKYGYPPDMRELATETVMKEAELMAEGMNKITAVRLTCNCQQTHAVGWSLWPHRKKGKGLLWLNPG